ncbi:hypothetical protein IFM89_011759, partial [Coptis chinensis]
DRNNCFSSEIRTAPHMDNLVSIYRSMEVDSGLNIHVTQNAPSSKISDGENQLEGNGNLGRSDTGEVSHGKPKKQRKFRKKGSKDLGKNIENTSDAHLSVKPSFPAKKRVHVPQCLPSETPSPAQKYEERLSKKTEKGPWDGSNALKERPSFTAKGEPVFSPFFWLSNEADNNEDIERLSSQAMDIDRVAETPPQQHPTFSDIKESDNESPVQMTSNEKMDIQSKLADAFDSEMFEWTQRPCSPELCYTPVKDKVSSRNEFKNVQEKNEVGSQYFTPSREEPLSDGTKSINHKQGNESTEMDSLSTRKANTKTPKERKKSNKNGKPKRKKDSICVDKSHGDAKGLCKSSEDFSNDGVPNMRKEVCRRKKNTTAGTDTLKKATEGASQVDEGKLKNQADENMGTKLIDLSREHFGIDENLKASSSKTMKNRKSRSKRCNIQNQNVDTSVEEVLKEVSTDQEQRNENGKNQFALLACQKYDNRRTYSDGKIGTSSKEGDVQVQRKDDVNPRKRKGSRISYDDTGDLLAGEVVKGCSKTAANKTHMVARSSKVPENKVLTVAKGRYLQKRESIPGQICCAFCQSFTDSKVSGEMMHYFSGRPVAPDYNGGSRIIHAHRNCTEWAPNVYFQDEIAINLESELARSRRIKCSCCGIKGAALGCYDTNCRKSFHVPCAKLVPQCRWDTEKFVMLCPLHPSAKLPKELPESQKKRQKQYISKRESQAHQAEVVIHHGVNTNPLWKGLSNKWVLCCSGLTIGEKETVTKFTKTAGISLLKTYGPSVTHIIASTDENGACRRTLKFLSGILEGKWILKIDWVNACMKAMEPVAEEAYEISLDIHGIKDGPQRGRLSVLNKQPKLFYSCNFYFMGEFVPSYKGYLQDLVVAAGGTVLQRKPISGDHCELPSASTTYVIYNAELPDQCGSGKKSLHNRRQARTLASSTGAKVAGHSWVLDSIAACKLQAL